MFTESFRGETIVPKLAPWVQGFLAELASGDTDYLSDFMDLDRFLHNLSTSAPALRKAGEHQARMNEQLEFVERSSPGDVMGIAKCRKLVEEAEGKSKDVRFIVGTDFKLAKEKVSTLLARIDRDEPILASAMRTHLPWRRRLQ